MVGKPYVSPSQVSLWIGDAWVDDACAIEYGQVSGKELYYGYADPHFRAVGQGRVVVTGSLTIHYRFTGYLTKMIYAAQLLHVFTEPGVRESLEWRNYVLEMVESIKKGVESPDNAADTLVRVARDYQQRLDVSYDEISGYFKKAFWHDSTKTQRQLKKALPPSSRADLNNTYCACPTDPHIHEQFQQVDIFCNFGPDDGTMDPERVEVIEDVHFTSNGKRVDNSSPEFGGMSVRERYEFVAKRVHPLTEGAAYVL
jgi:hypothetical protein